MPAETCPTCRTPYEGPASPGAKLVCAQCMEEFVPGGSKAAPPLPIPLADDPAPAPTAARPAGTGRIAGAPKTPKTPKKAQKAEKAEKPKRRREDDDDPDESPRRSRRRAGSDGSRTVTLAALGGGLLLLVVCVGAGAWLFTRAGDARDREQAARAGADPTRPNDNPNLGPIVPPPNGPPAGGPELTPLAAFEEPPNPFKAGTQTKLRELRAVNLPAAPALPPASANLFRNHATDHTQIVHSPRHQLLFVRCLAGVWVYDLKADKVVGTRAPQHGFSDMSLSPDEAALYVADFGGENSNRTPIKPSHVHRFDLAARAWEDRKTPKIAWRIEAVDARRVLLLEQDQWVEVALIRWETDGGLRDLSSLGTGYQGDIEYDPRTGRMYHGNRGTSSLEISVRVVEGEKLRSPDGVFGSGTPGGGGSVVLSQDGSRLYYGAVQVGTRDLKKPLEKFPEVIFAASRDIAFGGKAYYRAADASKLGEFAFKTMAGDLRDQWNTTLPVIAVSRNGLSVWVMDRDKNVVRQFALEGDA